MSAMTDAAMRRFDRVTAEARQVSVARALLTVVAAVLWAVGWLGGKVAVVVWAVVVWSAVAVRVGWDDARTGASADDGGG